MKKYEEIKSYMKKLWSGIKDAGVDIKDLASFFLLLFVNKETVMVKKTKDTLWFKLFNFYIFVGLLSNDIFFPGFYIGRRKLMRSLSLALSSKHGIKIGIARDKKWTDPESFVSQYRFMASDTTAVSFKTTMWVTALYIKNKNGVHVKYITNPVAKIKRFVYVKRTVISQDTYDVLIQKELYKTLDEKPACIHTPYIIINTRNVTEMRFFNVISFIGKIPSHSKWEAAPGVGTNNLHRTNKEDWILLGENTTSSFCLINAINALTRTINPPG